jgi:hypothetical protein
MMGWACSKDRGIHAGIWQRNHMENGHLEDKEGAGRIKLSWILRK